MNRIRCIRRIAALLAGLAAASLAFGATPAFAMWVPNPGAQQNVPPVQPARVVTHTVVLGGMPGWQITLIAVGAALVAAAAAVLVERALAGHHKAFPSAA